MYSLLKLVLTACVLLNVAHACDVYDTNTAVCAKDLEEICGVSSFPDSIQSLYDSRLCLRKNRDSVSKDCLDYVELDKPSIVDSCFIEMKSYCLNVAPGGFRVHRCLSAVPKEDLSLNCQAAMAYDEKIIQEKLSSENQQSVDFWNTWAAYVARIAKDISETQKMFITPYFQVNSVPTNYLRGSWLAHLEKLDEQEQELAVIDEKNTDDGEDTVRVADDDAIYGVEGPITDDEVDDDDVSGALKSQIFASAGSSTRLRDVDADNVAAEGPEPQSSVSAALLVNNLPSLE